ncbi:hypothetical protein M569_10784, partial [Genlisea aurea]
HFFLPFIVIEYFVVTAWTNPNDFAALLALKSTWNNVPPNWSGSDPCGSGWDGISCINNRVVSITLASINLNGQLSSDITALSELQILDLSYNPGMTGPLPTTIGNLVKLTSLILVGCGFSGVIPSSIGSLQQLVYLSLNSNNFIGEIPPSVGMLSNLYWLDLADNKLSGSIPVSSGSIPGLDMLANTKHFHFGNNQLSGQIPPSLFSSNLSLIHLLLENNRLTGTIPSTLGLVQSLQVLRLDRNSLSGSVPLNFNNLTSLQELCVDSCTQCHCRYLANNMLNGPLPNLSGMNLLNYVDMSNNSFQAANFPSWFSSLQILTTIVMENTYVQGQLNASLFSLYQLQSVNLKNNNISAQLDIGSTQSSQLRLIDLQNNSIRSFVQRGVYSVDI